jgi:hypothetical protein
MKTKELINKLYEAAIKGDSEKEKKIWLKVLKKSLKHKKTYAVK